MTDRELMQKALDAFEWNLNTDLDNISACEKWIKKAKKNIDALRARLAQPESEPVVPLEKYRKLSALCSRQSIRLMEYESAENKPVAWMYVNKLGGRQVSLLEPPKLLMQEYYPLYMTETKPQLTQRTGDCLLTGVCAAEGHRIAKEKPDQTPMVWMYQDKSTNEVKFQKEMRAFVDHGATYEVPLYATPPKKWVSLTDEERDEICLGDEGICRAVEAKLREKNGNL